LRDLGVVRHTLIQTSANGAFVFPPVPIFLHAGDTLTAVVKVRIGGHRPHHRHGFLARIATYGAGSITATHDGPAQLTVQATPAGKAALKRKGRLFVSVHLAFRSSARLGSSTSTKDFRLKLRKKH
jgi:hypothetical protein